MAFRTVIISNPAELHVHSGQLVAVQDQTVWIPIEDIAVLVIESPQVRVSSAALSLLAGQGVAVVVCDECHMPTGILQPHCTHSRHLAVVRTQLAATLPQKKRLWQALVRAKIENQARCLDALCIQGANTLRGYSSKVLSGDSTALEAIAARYYFPRIIPGVKRHSGMAPDPSLDYGYAVLRAAIARSLVGHGFYPALGLHHDGQLNPFNLADDVIEPFRPFVDLLVLRTRADVRDKAGRATLVAVLHEPCEVDAKRHSVLTAVDEAVASLARALRSRDTIDLHTPTLVIDASRPAALTE